MNKNKTLLQYVQQYQTQGYSIIPIPYKSKIPAIKWEKYQHEKPIDTEIKSWFSNSDPTNVAIICGKASGSDNCSLVVTEFDSVLEYERFKSKVEERLGFSSLQDYTPVVSTSRGYHVYWMVKEAVASQHFKTVEIRSDGNYVMAPPSIHPGGKPYELLNPDVTTPSTINSLVDIGIDTKQKPPTTSGGDNWITKAMQGVPEGQRDDTCTKLAGYYLNHHAPDIVKTILYTFADKCQPPLPHRDVDKCVDSITRGGDKYWCIK